MPQSVETVLEQLTRQVGERYYGKYGGVVLDNADPLKLARLKVRVPSLMQGAEIGWARPALPFAGPGHGLVMVPEVDAMVWVEFEAGNLNQPIWSGCFYAENQSAPGPSAPGGHLIVTPKGHRVVLDDDGDKLVVTHSGGAMLEMTATEVTLSIGASKMVMSTAAISFNDGVLKIGPAGVSLANGAMTLGDTADMSPMLTTTSTVMCPHFGQALLSTGNSQALVDHAPLLLLTDRHTVAGCSFAPGGVPSPCVQIQWLTGATQAKVQNMPVLLQTSVGLCLNALQVPQGSAVVVQTQTQALGV